MSANFETISYHVSLGDFFLITNTIHYGQGIKKCMSVPIEE